MPEVGFMHKSVVQPICNGYLGLELLPKISFSARLLTGYLVARRLVSAPMRVHREPTAAQRELRGTLCRRLNGAMRVSKRATGATNRYVDTTAISRKRGTGGIARLTFSRT